MNIVLGKYTPFNTPIHKIDERTKIFAFIIGIVVLFLPYKYYTFNFLVLGIGLVTTITLLIISRVRIHTIFSSLKSFWFLMLLIFILQIFIPGNNKRGPMWNAPVGSFMIYWESIFIAINVLLRILILMGFAIVLTSTSKPLNLTRAFEWYMFPLRAFRFPVSEVAMMISLALRLIPTLLDETLRLMKAQECRGLDFKNGSLKNKFRGIIALIVPLFASTFKRSDELANAMIVRGYDPKAKRTYYSKLKFKFYDFILIFLMLCLLAFAIVVLNIPGVFQDVIFNDAWIFGK